MYNPLRGYIFNFNTRGVFKHIIRRKRYIGRRYICKKPILPFNNKYPID